MVLVRDIIGAIEEIAPLSFQEDYDNAGLITGDKSWECTGALLSLDCVESVIEEAIKLKCNLIIAHHPIVFKGLKKITGSNYVERTIIKAIKNDIAIYACHTNIDNVQNGVNAKIAEKLGLQNTKILAPKSSLLKKLVVFVPASHVDLVREAVFAAGAGNIGNYSNCSFNTNGIGTFKGNGESKPFLGKQNELSKEEEVKIECVFESHLENGIIGAMLKAHPYEEVAYDILAMANKHKCVGSGLIGELPAEMAEMDYLQLVKERFNIKTLKHTVLTNKKVKKVAVCGGSGAFLLKNAINSGADSYISGDFKYHEYFDAEGKILVADIGHYESEQYTPEIFYGIIQKKFAKFALHLSKTNTNPVNYF
ncbi:MAG: Nif3-like dinuclear metal center hexameric protein [Bacteroidia bacterium]|nr:Nif3-like dinuclear metal center hexameric protein [Bacteroidia bacterium]